MALSSLQVTALQHNLNARLRARGRQQIAVDGEYGPATAAAVHLVKYLLGFDESALDTGPTTWARTIIAHPDRRPAAYLQVAADRAAFQAKLAKERPLREVAFNVGRGLLGVVEEGGNNRGPVVSKIIVENGGVVGEPWCGDFVAYCYRHAGSKAVNRSWASVYFLGRIVGVEKTASPMLGDIVRYRFSHTGLFRRWRPDLGPGKFEALEGNTGRVGAVSDSKTGGDGVYLKVRHVSQVDDFRHVTR